MNTLLNKVGARRSVWPYALERIRMIGIARIALATALVSVAALSSGCSRSVSLQDIIADPSAYLGNTVTLKDVAASHYFWLPEVGKGAYEIGGGGASVWVVAERPTPQTGDAVNLTGTVADNFSLGDYYLGLVIIEKSRRLVYDYPGPSGQPVPTRPPSRAQIVLPPAVNLFASPGTDPPAEEISLSLRNEASPNWSARVDKPWLKVNPVKGDLTAGEDRITVEADASQFPIGVHEATITVRIETTEREVPVRVYVTYGVPGQKIEALVETAKGTAWSAGIRLDGPIEVSAGQLERSLFVGTYFYDAGDMSVFVKGTLANDSDQEWQADFWPEAFDAEGRQVAWGLDMGGAPLAGHLQMNIAAHSSRPFTLHLTWAEDVERITINANKYDPWPPLP